LTRRRTWSLSPPSLPAPSPGSASPERHTPRVPVLDEDVITHSLCYP
jgi:hypothetical protein